MRIMKNPIKNKLQGVKDQFNKNPNTNVGLVQDMLHLKYTQREINLRAIGTFSGIFWGFIISNAMSHEWLWAGFFWFCENAVRRYLISWNDKETGTKKNDKSKEQNKI